MIGLARLGNHGLEHGEVAFSERSCGARCRGAGSPSLPGRRIPLRPGASSFESVRITNEQVQTEEMCSVNTQPQEVGPLGVVDKLVTEEADMARLDPTSPISGH